MTRSRCHGCGAEIIWIKTEAGKSMPCNPGMVPFWERPKASGKIITQRGRVISCDLSGERDSFTGFGYVSHFSTCTKERDFRKK